MGRGFRRDALAQGTVVGAYAVDSILGHGGFGIVYKARHLDLGTTVAIKEYLPIEIAVRLGHTVHPRSDDCVSSFEEGRNRFLQEAKQLSRFRKDPGIVTCLDFFRANGTAYLVMEREQGMPLSELLVRREADRNPLDEADLLAISEPLLQSLSRVHKAGVLHRDIKPSNILISRQDGRPILIDFGAAKQTVVLQTKSFAPYTEGYAAIEQVGEGSLGPWTDIYGVGAVLWRIVAGGKPPWNPPNPTRVESRLSAIVRGGPDPLPTARKVGVGRFTPSLLDAIDSCLILPEADRAQDCEQLLRTIRSGSTETDGQLGRNETDRSLSAAHEKGAGSGRPIKGSQRRFNRLSLYLIRFLAGLFGVFVGMLGRGLLMESFAGGETARLAAFISLILHLAGMILIYLVFFRWSRAMISPPMVPTQHRIPLACGWILVAVIGFMFGFMMFVVHNAGGDLSVFVAAGGSGRWETVILSSISIVVALGMLYRSKWARIVSVLLSFAVPRGPSGLIGFTVACYTFWVYSSSTGITDADLRADLKEHP